MTKLILATVLSCSLPAMLIARGRTQGDCAQGNNTIATAGIVSTTKVMRSFPSCTVTVYLAGTVTLAAIFSDDSGTSLGNPFTSDATGHWLFYADDGRYDVKLSGAGISPTFTLGDFPLIDPQRPGLVRIASDFISGSDAGAKIGLAETDLPSSGGVIDARGLIGVQSGAAAIIVNKPTTLLLCNITFTGSFTVTAAFTVLGCNKDITAINPTSGTANIFTINAAGGFVLREVKLAASVSQTAGAFISITGPGGATTNAHSIIENTILRGCYNCISVGTVEALRIENNQIDGVEHRAILWNNTSNSDQGDSYIAFNAFAFDSLQADTAAIEVQSGDTLTISGNKFFTAKYAFYLNWSGTGTSAGSILINGNRFDGMATATAEIVRASGTGTFVGLEIIGNYFNQAGGTGTFVDVASNATGWFSNLSVIGNFMSLLTTGTAINLAGGLAGNASFITSNHIVSTGGTAKGVVVGTGFTQINVDLNSVLGFAAGNDYQISSGLRGNYFRDKVAFGAISSSTTLSEQTTIPNATYYGGLSSGGVAQDFIGQDASDILRIGNSNQQVNVGSSGTAGGNLAVPNNRAFRTYAADGITFQRLISQDALNNVQIAQDSQPVVIQGSLSLGSLQLTGSTVVATVTNGTGVATPANCEKFLQLTINAVNYKICLYKP